MMNYKMAILNYQINFTRNNLANLITGEKNDNDEILKISQELDELIGIYQRLIKDKEKE